MTTSHSRILSRKDGDPKDEQYIDREIRAGNLSRRAPLPSLKTRTIMLRDSYILNTGSETDLRATMVRQPSEDCTRMEGPELAFRVHEPFSRVL
jgi:hypothetical protein